MAGPLDVGSPAERAWKQTDAAAYPELLEAITEWLNFHGLFKAAAALQEERLGTPDIRRPLAGTEGASRLKADLVRAWAAWHKDAFRFMQGNPVVGASPPARSSVTVRMLLLPLQLRYFDQGRVDFFFAAFKQYVAASAEEAQKVSTWTTAVQHKLSCRFTSS